MSTFQRLCDESQREFEQRDDEIESQRHRRLLRVWTHDGGRILVIKRPPDGIDELWICQDELTGLRIAVAELRDDDD